jgi:hypothetical protein
MHDCLGEPNRDRHVHPIAWMAHGWEPDRTRIRLPSFDVAGTELVSLAHIVTERVSHQHVAIDAEWPHDRLQPIGERDGHAGHAAEVVGLSSAQQCWGVVVGRRSHLLEALELRLGERKGK